MAAEFTPSHRGGSGTPLVLVHGFTDTWRTWDLVLPELERHHDVLAPTLVVALTAEDVERKMRSIRAYASQVHDPKSAAPETRISRPEFLEAIVARMRTHGGAIGAEFGEPWCADGAIRVNALDALLA